MQYLICSLCEQKFATEKTAEIVIISDNKEQKFFICKDCAETLSNLHSSEYKIIREKKKLPQVYIPERFKKFAVLRLK